MSQAVVQSTGPTPGPFSKVDLKRGFNVLGWLALYRNSVWQFCRGKRLLALAFLFALPVMLAGVVRYYAAESDEMRSDLTALELETRVAERTVEMEEVFLFYMIPQALVPLTALILASGMIRDEQEGQTLTYLLIRPISRPSIYLAKLLAAWSVASGLATVFIVAVMAVIHWGAVDFWGEIIPKRALEIVSLSVLSLLVYTSLFGAMSLIVRWVLPFGVGYIIMFEGVFANIDFIVRKLTVLWYVRILAERWFEIHGEEWGIDLEEVPTATNALATLLIAGLVMSVAAAFLFSQREIRVKTPEGG